MLARRAVRRPRTRRLSAVLGLVAGAVATAAMAAPASADPPAATVLPAVARALQAPSGTACDSTAYRAPRTGQLDVRLRGRGDWDLELRDGARKRLAASRGFGGRELAQIPVRAGQSVVVQGCRRGRGAGEGAQVVLRLVEAAAPRLSPGPVQLLRVRGNAEQLQALEAAGLDVTHARGRGWADVIVSGVAQLAAVATSGLTFTTRDGDLARSYTRARGTDGRYAARAGTAGSPLPSGRTGYRTYEDVQAELKELAERHPGLVRKAVFGTSFQGREISGLEIARDVGAADGRPVYFVMALHHAREWPSLEAAMELAHLLVAQHGDTRIANLLARVRVVILPIVNPDGFVSSRRAFDPGDSLFGQDPTVTLVEAIAPFGGLFAYRRKTCNGELAGPELPCELAWGVDPNRNYGNLWGGPGSSSDVTSQSYHGPRPRSEPEVQAVWNYVRSHHVTTLMSIHNVAALVLRPPGLQTAGLAPDEPRMKAIGDAMGAAAGYSSQYGFQLYDTAGTTEDDSYAATGGYGFTVEMGPPDGNFHMPYETGVVREWTGENGHADGRGGLREALLLGAEAAARVDDHAVLTGAAPSGRVLRLRKRFQTTTSPYCEKGVEPLVTIVVLPRICLTGEKPPLVLDDEQDTTTTVPASGRYAWHIGQSTRPFVGRDGDRKEAYELTCEEPGGGAVLERHSLVIDRGQALTLNLGCGTARSTFGDGTPLSGDAGAPLPATAPSVDGVLAPAPTARSKRARRLASCRRSARRVRNAARRRAALRTCARRHGERARQPTRSTR